MPSISNLVGGDFLKGYWKLENSLNYSCWHHGVLNHPHNLLLRTDTALFGSVSNRALYFSVFFFKAYIQIILLVIFAPVMLLFHQYLVKSFPNG